MVAGGSDTTLSQRTGRARAAREGRLEPHLLLAVDCTQPLAGSARCSLGELEAVTIGRASDRRFERVEARAGKTLAIGLPDRWMSKLHAQVRRVGEHWMVEDARSKNGTILNGSSTERALLAPGDLIELGRTLILFGQSPAPASDLAVTEATQLVTAFPGLPTWHAPLAHALAGLEAIARSRVPVILRGESGTGKEVVARAVHQVSGRPGAMLAVNCGAISETLVESELFGYRKGAFTGADEDRPGLFRSADRGTVLLDEIGDLSEQGQAALLRVLQEQEVVPVGAARAVKVDVRVVAATQTDLKAMVVQGRFRGDLLARLAGYVVDLPPVRERREDLALLIPALLRRLAPEHAEEVSFAVGAARALFAYDWPLNVRELEQALRAAVVLAGSGPIELDHLPKEVRRAQIRKEESGRPPPAVPAGREERGRRDELEGLLRQHAGNVSAVARAIGKTRAQVHRWIRRYALNVRGFRR